MNCAPSYAPEGIACPYGTNHGFTFALQDIANRWAGRLLVRGGRRCSVALALEERLDAMVDRAMRRLAQVKFMKQVSGSCERQAQSATALQIEGPRKPKRPKNSKLK